MSEVRIDPVLMQIIGGELDSIAKEMAHQLIRSARSALIRESEDMGAALLNTRCEEIAESDNTPLHVGSLVAYTQGMLETIAERGIELRPGDVLAAQPPVSGREPLAGHRRSSRRSFHDGELIGFSGEHRAPPRHRRRLPGRGDGPHRHVRRGDASSTRRSSSARASATTTCGASSPTTTRVPREVMGDLACQIASAQHGVRRLEGLVEKHSWPVVRAYSDALIDYAERMLRTEIAKIPDGTYHAEGWLDDDGVTRDVPRAPPRRRDRRRARTSPSTSPTRRPSGPTR